MSVTIRLQNLPLSANAANIREFFHGLHIPDGGVNIIGGEQGDAFIVFATDEDARKAMLLSGQLINNVPIRLLLSSKSEMQALIADAQNRVMRQEPAAVTATEKRSYTFYDPTGSLKEAPASKVRVIDYKQANTNASPFISDEPVRPSEFTYKNKASYNADRFVPQIQTAYVQNEPYNYEYDDRGGSVPIDRMVPGVERMNQGSDRIMYGSERMTQGPERVMQGSERITPGSERIMYGSERIIPGSEKIGFASERMMPGSERMIPGSEKIGYGSERMMYGSERMMYDSERIMPVPERNMYESERMVPGSERMMYESERMIPGSERMIPGSERMIYESERIMPGSERMMYETERIIPGTEKTRLNMDPIYEDRREVPPLSRRYDEINRRYEEPVRTKEYGRRYEEYDNRSGDRYYDEYPQEQDEYRFRDKQPPPRFGQRTRETDIYDNYDKKASLLPNPSYSGNKISPRGSMGDEDFNVEPPAYTRYDYDEHKERSSQPRYRAEDNRRNEENPSTFAVKAILPPYYIKYRTIFDIFRGISIVPKTGIRIEYDEDGRLTNYVYIKFVNNDACNKALRLNNRNYQGVSLELEKCSIDDFNLAKDINPANYDVNTPIYRRSPYYRDRCLDIYNIPTDITIEALESFIDVKLDPKKVNFIEFDGIFRCLISGLTEDNMLKILSYNGSKYCEQDIRIIAISSKLFRKVITTGRRMDVSKAPQANINYSNTKIAEPLKPQYESSEKGNNRFQHNSNGNFEINKPNDFYKDQSQQENEDDHFDSNEDSKDFESDKATQNSFQQNKLNDSYEPSDRFNQNKPVQNRYGQNEPFQNRYQPVQNRSDINKSNESNQNRFQKNIPNESTNRFEQNKSNPPIVNRPELNKTNEPVQNRFQQNKPNNLEQNKPNSKESNQTRSEINKSNERPEANKPKEPIQNRLGTLKSNESNQIKSNETSELNEQNKSNSESKKSDGPVKSQESIKPYMAAQKYVADSKNAMTCAKLDKLRPGTTASTLCNLFSPTVIPLSNIVVCGTEAIVDFINSTTCSKIVNEIKNKSNFSFTICPITTVAFNTLKSNYSNRSQKVPSNSAPGNIQPPPADPKPSNVDEKAGPVKIKLKKLPTYIGHSQLSSYLKSFKPQVVSIQMCYTNNRHNGEAVITLKDEKIARQFKQEYNGTKFKSNTLEVEFLDPPSYN